MAANKEQLLEERLQALGPDHAKTVTATTVRASATSRHFISHFRQASSSKSWLLFGVLLAFTIAASWPTGTSALPRRSRGSELAWHRRGGDAVTTTERSLPHVHLPHRRYNTPNPVKRFRKHRRTTRDLKVQIFPTTPKPNTHASEDIVQVVIVNISMTETLNRGQCAWKMSDTTLFAARLKTAFDVVQDTKEAIVCLIDEWLDYSSNQTMEQALHEIKLHRLLLEHPLKKEVEHVEFIDHTYKYQGSVGSPKDEMPRILAALNVLDNFVKHLNLTGKFGAASRAFTHKYISEKITHNLVKALELSHLQECATPDYTFNSNHARLEFAAYNETLKVLTVVEHMYRHWTAESKV